MADRISRVVTRTGDGGETSLADGKRYPKHHPRLALIGTLDEANSFIGLLAAKAVTEHRESLTTIQSRLFDVGGAVATGGTSAPWADLAGDVAEETERLNADLPALREFVLPGGSETVSLAHVARSLVRRAERTFWEEAPSLPLLAEAGVGAYLNRLSDYFFVLARTIAREHGVAEVLWEPL
ncbi:MAG: cob(I)yrinic acid a,c-diamide adenosyltransferase [Gammaproteobacteria bacterium]|nr:cob(I)yrinic acid a,c-diamide adenosyltransferase [Gammaproteobacteria bacterium]MYE82222.1 cob(I)yrinic acid a,c-diamide adenosyltransferase [Gammaproteobacteria bacterium]